jgi:hypothetical protein
MNVILFADHCERDSKWAEKAQSVFVLQGMRKELERQEAELIAELKAMTDGVSSKANGFAYSRSERKGSVDYEKIEVLKTINLELYRKPTIEIWKLIKYE